MKEQQKQSNQQQENTNRYIPDLRSLDYFYHLGELARDISISENRFEHLSHLNDICHIPKLKVSVRDINNGNWTKWQPMNKFDDNFLRNAYEIHRSVLGNEIVIESDYENYEQNVEASKFIGTLLQSKGFIPHYYYGGNKSLHIHVFFNFEQFIDCDETLLLKLKKYFTSQEQFYQEFILWLREEIISNWSAGLYEFDTQLIAATHLIRSELSYHKKGYKTFLGYDVKDIPSEPYLCNPQTKNYPEIASCFNPVGETKHQLKLSNVKDLDQFLANFLSYYEQEAQRKKNLALKYQGFEPPKKVRKQVDFIYSDKFSKAEDGYKRASFILINEFLRFYPPEEVKSKMLDWNSRMGFKVEEKDINFRVNYGNNSYFLTNKYINEFLEEVGFDATYR